MLVLTRKPGESIVIGNEITVTVVEVRGDQIRLGIDAPRSVQVYREEVFREIERENAQAVAGARRASDLLGGRPTSRPASSAGRRVQDLQGGRPKPPPLRPDAGQRADGEA